MFLKVKITDNANSLLNLVETKFYKEGLVMFVLIFANFNLTTPQVISHCPTGDASRWSVC